MILRVIFRVLVVPALMLLPSLAISQNATRPDNNANLRSKGGVGLNDSMAEDVIRILRENPPLMIDAKSQISAELARRGFPVNESELTDARIFSQIRTNPDFRDMIAEALRTRGFLEAGERGNGEPRNSDEEKESADNAKAAFAKEPLEGDNDKRKDRDLNKKTAKQAEPALRSRPNPYKDVPALADLYRQFNLPGKPPERFGAELFKEDAVAGAKTSNMDMPLGTDYILGPGDGVSIDLFGTYSQRFTRTVDHEGRVSLPEVGNVLVAGSSIGAAQASIEKALKRQYRDVTVELAVTRLRRARVYVVGDVKKPGAYDLSALSTVLTGLFAAGGPTEVGSLRTVQHIRNRKQLRTVDLYELMLHGVQGNEEQLQSGDSILVPPAGPQVTVTGMVRRPAIYELSKEETLREVLDLAGGVMVAGELSNIKVERIQAHSRREMLNLKLDQPGALERNQAGAFAMMDGDTVTISPILPYSDKVVYLQGHVFRPGRYPFREGMTLLDVIPNFQQLLPEPADKAELIRLRPPDFRPSVISVDLRGTLDGTISPIKLEPFDTVRLVGRYENDAPTVSIFGEVLRPGEYPLSDRMTAADLVRMAGGFKRSAYLKSADLSSYLLDGEKVALDHREVEIGKAVGNEADTDVRLKPGDVLTIRQLGQWSEIGGSINVRGAVLYPGRYGIQQGERLSAVLRRAGGFVDESYPAGAVLERTQVREIATKSKDQLIQRLESQGADLNRDTGDVRIAAAQQRQKLIDRLKATTPSGRLVIRILPNISEWENTDADIEIRPGDSLYIPKKPNFVVVDGQVYSPSAITFAPGRTAGWYLKQAGGPTEFANRKDIFIVRANGSVIGRDSGSWWSGGVLSAALNPGDTLVVPEKMASGSSFWRELGQSAQVVSAIAIAARVATSF